MPVLNLKLSGTKEEIADRLRTIQCLIEHNDVEKGEGWELFEVNNTHESFLQHPQVGDRFEYGMGIYNGRIVKGVDLVVVMDEDGLQRFLGSREEFERTYKGEISSIVRA